MLAADNLAPLQPVWSLRYIRIYPCRVWYPPAMAPHVSSILHTRDYLHVCNHPSTVCPTITSLRLWLSGTGRDSQLESESLRSLRRALRLHPQSKGGTGRGCGRGLDAPQPLGRSPQRPRRAGRGRSVGSRGRGPVPCAGSAHAHPHPHGGRRSRDPRPVLAKPEVVWGTRRPREPAGGGAAETGRGKRGGRGRRGRRRAGHGLPSRARPARSAPAPSGKLGCWVRAGAGRATGGAQRDPRPSPPRLWLGGHRLPGVRGVRSRPEWSRGPVPCVWTPRPTAGRLTRTLPDLVALGNRERGCVSYRRWALAARTGGCPFSLELGWPLSTPLSERGRYWQCLNRLIFFRRLKRDVF